MKLSGFDTVYLTFQFHKVRLKAANEGWFGRRGNWFQFHKVRLKVNAKGHFLLVLMQFQFHKVRLKDRGVFKSGQSYVVSIPQGTIKSQFGRLFEVGVQVFQFHKVRLKVILNRV